VTPFTFSRRYGGTIGVETWLAPYDEVVSRVRSELRRMAPKWRDSDLQTTLER